MVLACHVHHELLIDVTYRSGAEAVTTDHTWLIKHHNTSSSLMIYLQHFLQERSIKRPRQLEETWITLGILIHLTQFVVCIVHKTFILMIYPCSTTLGKNVFVSYSENGWA